MQKIIVQKFGGSSLASISHIKRCADIVKKTLEQYNNIIVVVSAMGNLTDDLTGYLQHFKPLLEEADVVLSSGEQISAGLFAVALNDIGVTSCTMLNWQVPIITSNEYSSARINAICQANILQKLQTYKVVVIPGFQGITDDLRITTIGRGGSDITAMALAAEFSAEICEIYTDVDGIMRLNPQEFHNSDYLKEIGYQQLLEMSLGIDVLHTRAVDLAYKNKLKVKVISSYSNSNLAGTEIKKDLEDIFISGIIHKDKRVLLISQSQILNHLLHILNDRKINTELIIHNTIHNETKIVISKKDYEKLKDINNITINNIKVIENLSIIHIVGSSDISNTAIILKLLEELQEIKLEILTTTEIKIIIVVSEVLLEKVIEILLKTFNLDKSIHIYH